MSRNKNVKIYKASQVLLQKAGRGPIDPLKIVKAEKYISENKTNFKSLGNEYLEKLKTTTEDLKKNLNNNKFESQKQTLVEPIMRLKSYSGFFHYPLITDLANITLDCIESLKKLDQEALKIVEYFYETAQKALNSEMSGIDPKGGKDMLANMKNKRASYKVKKS